MSTNQESLDLGNTFIAHWVPLRGATQKIVGTRELAEEVMQEAYMKVTKVATALTIRQPLGYCFQVVRNLAIDYRRRLKLESHLFTVEEAGEHECVVQDTPEQIAIGRQNLLLVVEVLDGLPKRTRQVFEMYRLEGYTQREIGRKLGVSATLVNFMIREASDALAQCRHFLLNDL